VVPFFLAPCPVGWRWGRVVVRSGAQCRLPECPLYGPYSGHSGHQAHPGSYAPEHDHSGFLWKLALRPDQIHSTGNRALPRDLGGHQGRSLG
jgi:hypothetical protein